jgi:hypothetical protein
MVCHTVENAFGKAHVTRVFHFDVGPRIFVKATRDTVSITVTLAVIPWHIVLAVE